MIFKIETETCQQNMAKNDTQRSPYNDKQYTHVYIQRCSVLCWVFGTTIHLIRPTAIGAWKKENECNLILIDITGNILHVLRRSNLFKS